MSFTPDSFILPTPELCDKTILLATGLYSKAKNAAPHQMGLELSTEGFDCEQIWEQLMLFNTPMIKYLTRVVDDFVQQGDIPYSEDEDEVTSSTTPSLDDQHDINSSENEQEELAMGEHDSASSDYDDNTDIRDMMSEDEEDFSAKSSKLTRSFLPTPVDDDFFSLREMESFSERAEAWDAIQQSRGDKEDDEGSESEMNEFDLGLGIILSIFTTV